MPTIDEIRDWLSGKKKLPRKNPFKFQHVTPKKKPKKVAQWMPKGTPLVNIDGTGWAKAEELKVERDAGGGGGISFTVSQDAYVTMTGKLPKKMKDVKTIKNILDARKKKTFFIVTSTPEGRRAYEDCKLLHVRLDFRRNEMDYVRVIAQYQTMDGSGRVSVADTKDFT